MNKPMNNSHSEAQSVAERYAKREKQDLNARYSMLNPSVWQSVQERQRILIHLLNTHSEKQLSDTQVF